MVHTGPREVSLPTTSPIPPSTLSGIEDARIQVVTSSRSFQRLVTRTLGAMGARVLPYQPDPGAIGHGLPPQDLFIIDADSDGQTVSQLLQELSERQADAHKLVVSRALNVAFLQQLVGQGIDHLIARPACTGIEDLIDERELVVTVRKLLDGDIFGLEKYLPAWGIQVFHQRIRSRIEKGPALGRLEQFLDQLDCQPAITLAVMTAADELLMNALYDAPAETGASRIRKVDLRYACDGKNVAISVTDHFGSLERETLVRYLCRVGDGELAEIELKPGGAGIGLLMVRRSATQLVVNMEPGVRTEVIASFYVRGGVRAFRRSGQSLHIFRA